MGKILVTGASGFVGAALCSEMTRRAIPFIPALRKAVASDQYQIGDINARSDWRPALSGCDAVVHLAARVHQMEEPAADLPVLYRLTNVDASVTLARQAAESGVRKFLYVSTVKVNGEASGAHPFSSEDPPHPDDPYAISKWEAEQALTQLCDDLDMELVIVRPPLVYGPGVRANFARLMQLVRAGIPLPFGLVRNRRSLVALDNLVDFLLLCLEAPAASGRTWLVSDQHDLGSADLIRIIASAMRKPARLLPVPPLLLSFLGTLSGKGKAVSRLTDSLQVDARPATEILGWKPTVTVEMAIQSTVDHFLRHHHS
jgi:UDP-glucose 4-epimerase